MLRRRWSSLLFVAVIAGAALYVVWPSNPDSILPSGIPWPEGRGISIGSFERRDMRLGLDLQGGTRLLLQARLPEGAEGNIDDALDGTVEILRRRVDASGLAEAEITRQGSSQISIQLPGLTPDEARELLGRTALLRFCEQSLGGIVAGQPCDAAGNWVQATGEVDGKVLALTGQFLRPNAFIGFDAIGQPLVQFEWQGEGARLSEQVTGRLLGQSLGIFLDDELLSAPIVNAVISDRGVISGMSLDRARQLVIQLNSGALPVELSVLQEQQVDATLGADSVRRSILAAEIGFLLVVLFMVLYYRVPGILASLSLLIYGVLTLAIFKLIPVTLTLAGIGAFVLSVGMAVDANILIFERMKEELRAGRGLGSAIDIGFNRAWPAIRDGNFTTLIIAAILFWFGERLGVSQVQGFALTLAIGVGLSMLTAIFVTRRFLHLFVGTRIGRRTKLFMS